MPTLGTLQDLDQLFERGGAGRAGFRRVAAAGQPDRYVVVGEGVAAIDKERR